MRSAPWTAGHWLSPGSSNATCGNCCLSDSDARTCHRGVCIHSRMSVWPGSSMARLCSECRSRRTNVATRQSRAPSGASRQRVEIPFARRDPPASGFLRKLGVMRPSLARGRSPLLALGFSSEPESNRPKKVAGRFAALPVTDGYPPPPSLWTSTQMPRRRTFPEAERTPWRRVNSSPAKPTSFSEPLAQALVKRAMRRPGLVHRRLVETLPRWYSAIAGLFRPQSHKRARRRWR